MERCDMERCDMERCDMERCDMERCDMERCDMERVSRTAYRSKNTTPFLTTAGGEINSGGGANSIAFYYECAIKE